MKKADIIKLLTDCGFNNDLASTQLHKYTVPRNGRKSFATSSLDNRSNTPWGRGEYIIVPYEPNSTINTDTVLKNWKILAGQYQNQYLILGVDDDNWELYDYNGKLLGGNVVINKKLGSPSNKPIQQIYYGAPGTGKSFTVYEKYEKNTNDKFIFRTTFHPDMDYSMFVGCYKPKSRNTVLLNGSNLTLNQLLQKFKDSANYTRETKARYLYEGLVNAADIVNLGLDGNAIANALKKSGFTGGAYTIEVDYMVKMRDWLEKEGHLKDCTIDYEFVPQTFTDAYVAAWKDPENAYYLIIEEINRGNCAQIFGDLFQLLDRDKTTGLSKYRIKADNDLCDYLITQLPIGCDGIKDDKLCLPPNLNIIATMNTSDQSLFPMDSAFKRRWEWEYVPIQYEQQFTIEGVTKPNRSYDFIININSNNQYSWIQFIKEINKKIYDLTGSEDKQIGNYFVDLPSGEIEIDEKTFKNKVMFYLWNDICKDEVGNQKNFYCTKDEEFSFNQLFEANGQQLLIKFLDNIEGIKMATSTPAGTTPPVTPQGNTSPTSAPSGNTPNGGDEQEK